MNHRNKLQFPTKSVSALNRFVHRKSKGQMLVIMALVMVGLLAVVALSADAGWIYFEWQFLQRADDAAVAAGANYLPDNSSLATSTASTYAQKNGILAGEIVSDSVAPGNQSISMQITRKVPLFFANVIGLKQATLTVNSSAGVPYNPSTIGGPGAPAGSRSGSGSSIGSSPLLPIGLDSTTTYVHDGAITLNYSEGVGPGNWGSLALGGVGGSNLRSNIANGYFGPVSIGDWITTEPGKKVGPFDQGFSDRITAGQTAYPSDTYSNFNPNDPRAVILPVVDWSTAKGRSQVAVKGFASVWVNSESGGSASAYFISMIAMGGNEDSTAPNYGVYGMPKLLK